MLAVVDPSVVLALVVFDPASENTVDRHCMPSHPQTDLRVAEELFRCVNRIPKAQESHLEHFQVRDVVVGPPS